MSKSLSKFLQSKATDGNTITTRLPVGYLKNTILHGWSVAREGNSYYGEDSLTGWQRIDNSADDASAMVITALNASPARTYDSMDNHVAVLFNQADVKAEGQNEEGLYRNDHDTYVYNPFNILRKNRIGWQADTDTIDLSQLNQNGITFDRRTVTNMNSVQKKANYQTTANSCRNECNSDLDCYAAVMTRGSSYVWCSHYKKGAIIGSDSFDSKLLSTYIPSRASDDVIIWPF
jgi:hypothetical protein